jgi:hypothetical protein
MFSAFLQNVKNCYDWTQTYPKVVVKGPALVSQDPLYIIVEFSSLY